MTTEAFFKAKTLVREIQELESIQLDESYFLTARSEAHITLERNLARALSKKEMEELSEFVRRLCSASSDRLPAARAELEAL